MDSKTGNSGTSHELHVTFYKRLWVKAFLINIVFLIFLLFVLFYLIYSAQRNNLLTQLQKNTINSVEFIAQQLTLSVYLWDKQNIEDKVNIFLSNLSETNSISYISIYSKKFRERLVFGADVDKISKKPLVSQFADEHPDTRKEYKTDDFIYIIQPVIYKSNLIQWSSIPDEMVSLSPVNDDLMQNTQKSLASPNIGDIHICIKFDGINKTLKKSSADFIFLSIPVLLLSLIFHYFQTRLITRKLSILSEMAKSISDGNYNIEISMDATDEIGILSRSFSNMVNKLVTSQKEVELRNNDLLEANILLDNVIQKVQNFNVELEKKVTERTSQLESLNITLQKKNKELKEADETKTKFLSMMSHELRTPLNAIIGFSQLALRKVKDDYLREFFTEIRQNGDHLLTLINDLLDFSKLQAGQFEIFVETFNLNKVIQDVLFLAHGLIINNPIEIKGCDTSFERPCFGDQIRFKQVLVNLVSNACKFTKKGYVEISCQNLTRDADILVEIPERFYNRTTYVMVKDTGMGIAEKNLKLIFDPFKQVDSSESRIHGTGLGLTISRSLIELHHCMIFVHSREGEGTAVYFLVPNSKKDMDELAALKE